jgi:TM2 domain protein
MTTPDPLANPIKPEDDTQASIPAPEAPSFPQASAPSFDEATATPGTTTYGTAYDPAGAAPEAQAQDAQQPYTQPAFGQPAFAQGVYANPPKQWIIALLLAFFVGPLGFHNFYLGYNSRGLIQLLLSVIVIGLPITAIWAFIEFIMIIMRSGSYGCDATGQPLV